MRVQSLGEEDPLEEGMATQSSNLAWRIPMDGGAWQATVHGVTKTEQLNTTQPNTTTPFMTPMKMCTSFCSQFPPETYL